MFAVVSDQLNVDSHVIILPGSVFLVEKSPESIKNTLMNYIDRQRNINKKNMKARHTPKTNPYKCKFYQGLNINYYERSHSGSEIVLHLENGREMQISIIEWMNSVTREWSLPE